MANATNTPVGRSVGHEWAVSVATSGQFCWPPTGSSYWPLTDVGRETRKIVGGIDSGKNSSTPSSAYAGTILAAEEIASMTLVISLNE
jgi:hypothetical protein